MNKTKINFYCPTPTVEILDKMAADDHRDRTSLLNKIIDFYLSHTLPVKNGTRPTMKKKAGAR